MAAIAAYAAGRAVESPRPPSQMAAGTGFRQPPTLADPYRLMQLTRSRIELLPAGLWADPLPVGSADEAEMPVPDIAAADMAPQPSEPAPVPPAKAPSGPGPDEIARGLSQEIRAITRSNGKARLLLRDQTTMQSRFLAVGDVYRDGWKIAQIETSRVILQRAKAAPVIVPIAFSLRPYPAIAPMQKAAIADRASTIPVAAPTSPEPRPRRRVPRPANASR